MKLKIQHFHQLSRIAQHSIRLSLSLFFFYRRELQTHLASHKSTQQLEPLSSFASRKTGQSPSNSWSQLQWWAGKEKENTSAVRMPSVAGFPKGSKHSCVFQMHSISTAENFWANLASTQDIITKFLSMYSVNATVWSSHFCHGWIYTESRMEWQKRSNNVRPGGSFAHTPEPTFVK